MPNILLIFNDVSSSVPPPNSNDISLFSQTWNSSVSSIRDVVQSPVEKGQRASTNERVVDKRGSWNCTLAMCAYETRLFASVGSSNCSQTRLEQAPLKCDNPALIVGVSIFILQRTINLPLVALCTLTRVPLALLVPFSLTL